MGTVDWAKVERQFFALEFVLHIMLAYDLETKGRRGAIGLSGVYVFEALSCKPGAFVRPVPFHRDQLITSCELSGRMVDWALKRLVARGLLTISRSPDAPMAQLDIPPDVFALYQQRDNRLADDPDSMAVERHELDAALARLDDPDFENYAERRPVLLSDPWLGHDRPAGVVSIFNAAR